MIGEYFRRRRVERTLAKFLDPKAVESLLRDDGKQEPIKHGRIEFILVFVRGSAPNQVSKNGAHVVDLAVSHGAMVYDVIGALVVAAFGTHPAASESGSRSSLVQDLRGQLAGEVKIVHGATDGHYGLLGNGTRISYTFLVPNFDKALGALSRLDFGECEEFHQ